MSEKDLKISEQEQDIVDITQLVNPFPGLRPFGIEESHLFFGREGQSDEILVKLSKNKFVAILGASGSGKSSLMYCGLIPTLHGGFMTNAGSKWRIVVTRSGGEPIDNLAESLLIKDRDYANLGEEDKLIRKTIISTVLRSSSLGLVEVVKQLKTDDFQNILILVDQFEELFRYKKIESARSDLDEASAFVNLLLEAVHQDEIPIFISLTMRSDFIGECAQFPSLTQMINDSHYLIPQMTREQKRIAIEGPVAVGGGKIVPRLTQQLLNDVGDNPDQLPILQHVLMRTWSYWTDHRKVGEPIDLRHYNAIGTLREALSQHANEAYDSLSKREKGICEVLFKALTERGFENQGIRRPTKLSTISAIAGVSEDEVSRVVERFREPGRSLLMPPFGIRLESDTVIDISHESLMRIWVRLKRWLDEESKAAEMYLKLSEASERYQEGKAGLWQMPDLQLALNWREENKPTLVWGQRYNPAFERAIVFLETSEKAYLTEQRNKDILQKRQVRRMRLTAILLSIATLITLTLVVFSQIKANEATKNQAIAEENQKLAEENAKEAKIQQEIATKSASEAKIAEANALANLERAQIAEADAKAQAQRAQQEAARAEREADAARRAEANALEAQQVAQQEKEAAETARKEAEIAQNAAERLRLQSVAQSMAIKSKTILSNDSLSAQLRGLVARQAYLFYDDYKEIGKEYNGDIYSGVYTTIQGLYRIDYQDRAEGDSALNQYIKAIPKDVNKSVGVRSVIYSIDGTSFYSANADGEVLKWDVDTRAHERIFKNDDIARVVNVSPNERYLACGTDQNNILIFNTNQVDQTPSRINAHTNGKVYDLVFLPDNSGFISVGADNRILKSNFDGRVKQLYYSQKRIRKITISPDMTKLAAGLLDGTVYIWDMENMSSDPVNLVDTKNRKRGRILSIGAIKFSHDGKYLAYGNEDGEIVIWDMELNDTYGSKLTGFRAPVTAIEFSPDNRLILATSRNSQVRIWDMLHIYDLPIILDDYLGEKDKGWVNDASFSPDGKFFITAAGDGIIRKYPISVKDFAEEICLHIDKGNMSDNEWRQYVGQGIDYVYTCEGLKKRSNQ